MKKILLSLMIFCSLSAAAQKKKPAKGKAKPAATAAVKKTPLAKADNLSAEMLEKKDIYLFYTLAGKDTLFSKRISKADGAPSDVKITPFTAAATAKLHFISWNQKKKIGDAKAKLENITESRTEIWDVANKKMVFDNNCSVNNITEIVWLDPNKTASKTEEKIRRNGMECSLLPQGDILLKNKSQESKLTYDIVAQRFVAKR